MVSEQYTKMDQHSYAIMIKILENLKFVYVMNRNFDTNLIISSLFEIFKVESENFMFIVTEIYHSGVDDDTFMCNYSAIEK